MSGQVIDLFSCVGGHALGYTRAGFQPLMFCEIDPWRRSKLSKHFPNVPIYEDVRDVRGTTATVIIGGPPCKRTSVAAAIHKKRTGETLWPHMLRVVNESDTEWVIVEQPPGNAEWEDKIQADLEALGWAVQWVTISAEMLGYPHIRRRRFAISHTDRQRLETTRQSISSEIGKVARASIAGGTRLQSIPSVIRMGAGLPRGMAYRRVIEALGDSNPPEMVEVIFKALKQGD